MFAKTPSYVKEREFNDAHAKANETRNAASIGVQEKFWWPSSRWPAYMPSHPANRCRRIRDSHQTSCDWGRNSPHPVACHCRVDAHRVQMCRRTFAWTRCDWFPIESSSQGSDQGQGSGPPHSGVVMGCSCIRRKEIGAEGVTGREGFELEELEVV